MSESLPSNHVHNGLSGIPYPDPYSGFPRRWTFYVPDFFVIYMDKNNKKHSEVIEIKPQDEVPARISGYNGKISPIKEAKQIVNAAKYQEAIKYCAKHGFTFRVCTEKDMFAFTRPKKS